MTEKHLLATIYYLGEKDNNYFVILRTGTGSCGQCRIMYKRKVITFLCGAMFRQKNKMKMNLIHENILSRAETLDLLNFAYCLLGSQLLKQESKAFCFEE